jgi:hypothetical protein
MYYGTGDVEETFPAQQIEQVPGASLEALRITGKEPANGGMEVPMGRLYNNDEAVRVLETGIAGAIEARRRAAAAAEAARMQVVAARPIEAQPAPVVDAYQEQIARAMQQVEAARGGEEFGLAA